MDKSNGYERIAKRFIEIRGQDEAGVGTLSVRNWVRSLPEKSTILDLGCGTGLPITKVLIDEGMEVYAIDASKIMVQEFNNTFPDIPVECESVEDSLFFNKQFDAIIAWGLIFLLSEEVQTKLLEKVASFLKKGGKLLFTAPAQDGVWMDNLTGQKSRSLGAKKYRDLLDKFGFRIIQEYKDEGENYYFDAIKL
ncbi:class I SAM-dependent methyltransferase [Christiangramia aquimixticola]|uniref:class I SAM-dependent methyltransferase n=1 Tax=Christiangramia aquimixticola TaxID=1697558 RepID=UPI003AA9D90C